MREKGQLEQLTILRGLAAWMVVLFHFRAELRGLVPGFLVTFFGRGYLAVDFFFCLSGFIIQLNYGEAGLASSWRAFRGFLAARLARIYPLHLFMMIVFLANPLAIHLFGDGLDRDHRYGAAYFVASIFLVQNWGFFDHLAWNAPAWSISAELFAYLFFPCGAWLVARWFGRRIMMAGGVMLLLAALAAIFTAAGATLGNDPARLGLLRGLIEFSAGMLLCRAYVSLEQPHVGVTLAAAAVAAGCIGLMALTPVSDVIVYPAASFAFILFLVSQPGFAVLARRLPALVYVGEISYSTYLVHFFVKDWVKFLVMRPDARPWVAAVAYVGAVAVLSVALHHAIEAPGRRALRALLGPGRFSRRGAGPVPDGAWPQAGGPRPSAAAPHGD